MKGKDETLEKAKDKILRSAKELFSMKNYREITVSRITDHAGVSNSVFYKYFKNKEDLIREIVNESVFTLSKHIESLSPCDLVDAVHTIIEFLCDYSFEHVKEMKILHEVEYTSINAARSVHEILDKYLKNFLKEKVEKYGVDVVHWFALGPLRFSIVYYTIWMDELVPSSVRDELKDFVLYGLDPNAHVMDHRVFDYTVNQISGRDDTTRLRLLQSAERLFGSIGFRETKVNDITNAADVALGTFYTYFENKEEILKYLVKRINDDLRHTIKQAIQIFDDRRDAEIAAYHAFLQFFKIHPQMYVVVREAEFFVPDIAHYYYERIKKSYLKPIESAIENEQFRKFIPENLAIFLMGIGHYMGMDLLILGDASETDFIRKLIKLSRLLYKGVKG